MSGSRLFLKLSFCLLLVAGTFSFSGCEKVPTWDEVTGEKKEEAPTPKPKPATKKKEVAKKPKRKPEPKAAPVKVEPEVAMATFKTRRARDISDDTLNNFIKDMGDKIGMVEDLNLDHAKITRMSLQNLDSFTNVRSIDLTSVPLDDETIELLGTMKSLESLNLDNSQNINVETLSFLQHLPNLKTLSLNNTSLKDETFEAFLVLDNLERLEFAETGVTGEGFSLCRKKKKLGGLKYINANNTRFGDYGFVGIKNLKDLEVLLVRKSIISDSSLAGLKGCRNLKRIDLGYNTLSDKGIKELSHCKDLENINLQDTKNVSNEALRDFTKMKNLTLLNLTGTRCSERGIKALKKKVKNVVVIKDTKKY